MKRVLAVVLGLVLLLQIQAAAPLLVSAEEPEGEETTVEETEEDTEGENAEAEEAPAETGEETTEEA